LQDKLEELRLEIEEYENAPAAGGGDWNLGIGALGGREVLILAVLGGAIAFAALTQ